MCVCKSSFCRSLSVTETEIVVARCTGSSQSSRDSLSPTISGLHGDHKERPEKQQSNLNRSNFQLRKLFLRCSVCEKQRRELFCSADKLPLLTNPYCFHSDFYNLAEVRRCLFSEGLLPIAPAFANPLQPRFLWLVAIWHAAFDFMNRVSNCFCSCYQCSLTCSKWGEEGGNSPTTRTAFHSCGSLPRPLIVIFLVYFTQCRW